MSDSGIGAMVHVACWLTDRLDIEVLSIGRSAHGVEDCVLEVVGTWLAYRIALRGGWVWLSASLADSGDEPEALANFADGKQEWRQVCSLIRALERHKIRSLQRPIEAGSGPSGWLLS
jgi:hypothetical protein